MRGMTVAGHRHSRLRHNCRALNILLAGIAFIFYAFTNLGYAQTCVEGVLGTVQETYTVQPGGCVDYGGNTLAIGDAASFSLADAAMVLSETADENGLSYSTAGMQGTANYMAVIQTAVTTPAGDYIIHIAADGTNYNVDFRLRVQRVQAAMVQTTTVAARKSADDKFDDFAIYSGVAILSTWAFNKYIINAPVKFTAMPTSNKSLQYNLSTDINKNWSVNFTVDKSVKINDETNNSNLYKVKFEYRF